MDNTGQSNPSIKEVFVLERISWSQGNRIIGVTADPAIVKLFQSVERNHAVRKIVVGEADEKLRTQRYAWGYFESDTGYPDHLK